jgi:hypothetical protein
MAVAAPNHGLPGLFQSNHASNTSAGVAGIVRMTVNSMVFTWVERAFVAIVSLPGM